MTTPTLEVLSEPAVHQLVRDWHDALDSHSPAEQVQELLAGDGLVMRLAEQTFRGHREFRYWYDAWVNRYFDETRDLLEVDVKLVGAAEARVRVVVRWRARRWDPPKRASTWLGFDMHQRWSIAMEEGGPKIRQYVVEDVRPMPGSGRL